MFHLQKPKNFLSDKAGSICFIECDGKFLILKRALHAPQGGTWTAAPGGKVEAGETPLQAALRETQEETGITLETAHFIHTVYFQFPDLEFALHLFYVRIDKQPIVTLQPTEHTEFAWKTLEETLKLPVMRGGTDCIHFIISHRQKWDKFSSHP